MSDNVLASSDQNLVWIDLEMTGLLPDTDRIIEIAVVVTDPAQPRAGHPGSSTAACWRRPAAPTCRCWSGCATCASSRPTWTSSSRCASPMTSRRRASRQLGVRAPTWKPWPPAHALIDEQYASSTTRVMPALQQQGIVILNHAERNAAQRALGGALLPAQVRPLLVPVSLDPATPSRRWPTSR
jgi:hypothetical protein